MPSGKQCAGHKTAARGGERCKNRALPGLTVCGSHGGKAPRAQKKVVVARELQHWGLGEAVDDPGQTLLRLITQSRMRADLLAYEIEQLIAESDSLRDALVGETWVSDDGGAAHKAGEYIRGLAQLEADERDRCANFCKIAIQAGLAERMVRLEEKKAEAAFAAMRAGLEDAGLGDRVAEVLGHVGRRLHAVSS